MNILKPKRDNLRDVIIVNICNYLLDHFASREYLRMFNICVGLGLSALDELKLEQDRKEQLEKSKQFFPNISEPKPYTSTFKTCRFDSNPVVEGTDLCLNHRPPKSTTTIPDLKDLREKEMSEGFIALTLELLPYTGTKWMLQNDAYIFLVDTCDLTWLEAGQVMSDLKEINAIRFNETLTHIQLNAMEINEAPNQEGNTN